MEDKNRVRITSALLALLGNFYTIAVRVQNGCIRVQFVLVILIICEK